MNVGTGPLFAEVAEREFENFSLPLILFVLSTYEVSTLIAIYIDLHMRILVH